jgi:hypothetical protein
MMIARLVIGLAAWICGVVCAITSGGLHLSAVERVNERLPADKAIEPLGWHVDKYWLLRHEYRRLYPDGKLLRKSKKFQIACLVSFVIGAWALHPYLVKIKL